MFLLIFVNLDKFKRADHIADCDCLLYEPGLIKPFVILNAYNVYQFDHVGDIKLTLLSQVSHSTF